MELAMERVLRLVAEGRLTAEEAGPILDALGPDAHPGRASASASATAPATGTGEPPSGGEGRPSFARIEVRDGGRRVVDLRIPISLGQLALGRIPGLSTDQLGEIEHAISTGARGPILDVEDADGDGVRILLE